MPFDTNSPSPCFPCKDKSYLCHCANILCIPVISFISVVCLSIIYYVCQFLYTIAFIYFLRLIHLTVSCFSRLSRLPTGAGDATEPLLQVPVLAFSDDMKMIGGEAGCAICLSEFVMGEEVTVLPKCKHGFHVKCMERWTSASSHTSCPTCRTIYWRMPPKKSHSLLENRQQLEV